MEENDTYWHRDGGYGFFCRPSATCIHDRTVITDRTAMFLLELHNSLNWRLKRGYSAPYAIDAAVHHKLWFSDQSLVTPARTRGFYCSPVLAKSSLGEQPIFILLWSLAFKKLETAKNVFFVGYSFPVTDLAAFFCLVKH